MYSARRPDLVSAVEETATGVTPAKLLDVDWKLNVCMLVQQIVRAEMCGYGQLMLASNKMAALREPRLLLNLSMQNADGSEQQVTLAWTCVPTCDSAQMQG